VTRVQVPLTGTGNETIRYVSLCEIPRYAIFVETANVRGSHGSQQGYRHILGLPISPLIAACVLQLSPMRCVTLTGVVNWLPTGGMAHGFTNILIYGTLN